MCVSANAAWYVVGQFNGWNEGEAPAMTDKGDGIFEFKFYGTMLTNFKIISEQSWSSRQLGVENADTKVTLGSPLALYEDGDSKNLMFDGGDRVKNAVLTLNENTKELTVTGEYGDATWYVVGEYQNWKEAAALKMKDVGNNVFELEIPGTMSSQFKIISEQSWNDGTQLGVESLDTKLDLGTPLNLFDSYSSKNIFFKDGYNVKGAKLTLNVASTPTLTVTGEYGVKPWYLVGEFQGWKPEEALDMTYMGKNIYEIEVPGRMASNFKIIEEKEWKGVQLGAPDADTKVVLGTPYQLVDENAKDLAYSGDYYVVGAKLTLDATYNKLTVTGEPTHAWFVVGVFQAWDAGTALELTKVDGSEDLYELDIPGTMLSEFKILDRQAWNGPQLGAVNGTSLTLWEDFQLTNQNYDNIRFADGNYVKNAILLFNETDKTLKVTGEYVDAAWYVIGAFQGWKEENAVEMTDMGDGIFELEVPGTMPSGFKITNWKDWDHIQLGGVEGSLTLGQPYQLKEGPGGLDITFDGLDYITNAKISFDRNTNKVTVTGTPVVVYPDLYLAGSWAMSESDPNRLWTQNEETKMSEDGGLFTKSYICKPATYECKVTGNGWSPQWGWYNAPEHNLSLTNPLVHLDKKSGGDPGNCKIDISLPGQYFYTYDYDNETLAISTALDFTVYVNDPSMLRSDGARGAYDSGIGIETVPFTIQFSDTPEGSGEYEGYYKGTISLPCYLSGSANTFLMLDCLEEYYIATVNGEPENVSAMLLFNAVVSENTSRTWVVDLRKEVETLNVIVADKGDAICTLGGTELTEGFQTKTYSPKTEQPMTLTVSNVPSGKEACVFLNNTQIKGNDNSFSIACNDGDKLHIVFEDEGASTETVDLGATMHGTYCSHHNLDFTENQIDVYAYKITGINDGVLVTERVTGIVPAGTGLYLEGVVVQGPALPRYDGMKAANAANTTFAISTTDETPTADVSGNKMQAAFTHEAVPASEPETQSGGERTCILVYDPVKDGFKENSDQYTSTNSHSYVQIKATDPLPPYIPTGIETIEADAQAPAMTGIYDLSGVRFPDNTDVKSLQPGFYIVNGKKLLVK